MGRDLNKSPKKVSQKIAGWWKQETTFQAELYRKTAGDDTASLYTSLADGDISIEEMALFIAVFLRRYVKEKGLSIQLDVGNTLGDLLNTYARLQSGELQLTDLGLTAYEKSLRKRLHHVNASDLMAMRDELAESVNNFLSLSYESRVDEQRRLLIMMMRSYAFYHGLDFHSPGVLGPESFTPVTFTSWFTPAGEVDVRDFARVLNCWDKEILSTFVAEQNELLRVLDVEMSQRSKVELHESNEARVELIYIVMQRYATDRGMKLLVSKASFAAKLKSENYLAELFSCPLRVNAAELMLRLSDCLRAPMPIAAETDVVALKHATDRLVTWRRDFRLPIKASAPYHQCWKEFNAQQVVELSLGARQQEDLRRNLANLESLAMALKAVSSTVRVAKPAGIKDRRGENVIFCYSRRIMMLQDRKRCIAANMQVNKVDLVLPLRWLVVVKAIELSSAQDPREVLALDEEKKAMEAWLFNQEGMACYKPLFDLRAVLLANQTDDNYSLINKLILLLERGMDEACDVEWFERYLFAPYQHECAQRLSEATLSALQQFQAILKDEAFTWCSKYELTARHGAVSRKLARSLQDHEQFEKISAMHADSKQVKAANDLGDECLALHAELVASVDSNQVSAGMNERLDQIKLQLVAERESGFGLFAMLPATNVFFACDRYRSECHVFENLRDNLGLSTGLSPRGSRDNGMTNKKALLAEMIIEEAQALAVSPEKALSEKESSARFNTAKRHHNNFYQLCADYYQAKGYQVYREFLVFTYYRYDEQINQSGEAELVATFYQQRREAVSDLIAVLDQQQCNDRLVKVLKGEQASLAPLLIFDGRYFEKSLLVNAEAMSGFLASQLASDKERSAETWLGLYDRIQRVGSLPARLNVKGQASQLVCHVMLDRLFSASQKQVDYEIFVVNEAVFSAFLNNPGNKARMLQFFSTASRTRQAFESYLFTGAATPEKERLCTAYQLARFNIVESNLGKLLESQFELALVIEPFSLAAVEKSLRGWASQHNGFNESSIVPKLLAAMLSSEGLLAKVKVADLTDCYEALNRLLNIFPSCAVVAREQVFKKLIERLDEVTELDDLDQVRAALGAASFFKEHATKDMKTQRRWLSLSEQLKERCNALLEKQRLTACFAAIIEGSGSYDELESAEQLSLMNTVVLPALLRGEETAAVFCNRSPAAVFYALIGKEPTREHQLMLERLFEVVEDFDDFERFAGLSEGHCWFDVVSAEKRNWIIERLEEDAQGNRLTYKRRVKLYDYAARYELIDHEQLQKELVEFKQLLMQASAEASQVDEFDREGNVSIHCLVDKMVPLFAAGTAEQRAELDALLKQTSDAVNEPVREELCNILLLNGVASGVRRSPSLSVMSCGFHASPTVDEKLSSLHRSKSFSAPAA